MSKSQMSENESDYAPRRIANFSKYHKPDTVLRPGRLYRGEKKFVGNSSMAPRKDHTSKALTLRGHRLGLKKKHNSTVNQEVHKSVSGASHGSRRTIRTNIARRS